MSTQTHKEYSRSFLYDCHWNEGLSLNAISNHYSDGDGIVDSLLRSSIPTRKGYSVDGWVFRMLPKRTLYQLYWADGCTLDKITSMFNISVGLVRQQFDSYGIPRRKRGNNVVSPDTVPSGYDISDTDIQSATQSQSLRGRIADTFCPDVESVTDSDVRDRLYQLHWGDGLYLNGIEEAIGASRHTVRQAFDIWGVPIRSNISPESWVFKMLSKRLLYELYWKQQCTTREIASQFNVSRSVARRTLIERCIPIRQGSVDQWYPNDVPKGFGYEYDDSPTRVGAGTDELPDDPDPSKYIESYEAFDPDRLYELHWGYGLSITHMNEYFDVGHSTVRHTMDEHGIPRRDKTDDPNWEPHLGVPPMFEWEHGVPPSEHEETTDLEDQHGSTSWTDFSKKVRSDVRGDE